MEERLQELGDPSGQQTSEYWNEWFSVVGSERQFFEWYCDAKEVARVLDYHLPYHDDNNDDNNDDSDAEEQDRGRRFKMIHPGAGNSLVPHKLRSRFPRYDHVVVDISPVALKMATESLTTDPDSSGSQSSSIQFLVGDVLKPPLHSSLAPDSFDAWIDKGLVDALFDKEHGDENHRHAATLFQEARRLLTPNGGFVFIITLAEEHSLELMLHHWNTTPGWSPTLHVWEMVPITGRMRPFGIVLAKEDFDSHKKLVMHHLGGGVFSTTVHALDAAAIETSSLVSTVAAILEESRRRFQSEEENAATQHGATADADASPYRLLATIEVKPYDDEVDLMGVCQQITSRSYTDIGPIQWVAWNDPNQDGEEQVLVLPPSTGTASYAKLVPMAFGLSKLVLRCLVPSSDELEAVIEDVMDWHADNGDDCIQSIDIDWDATCPVGNVKL